MYSLILCIHSIYIDCVFGTQHPIPEYDLSMRDLKIRFKEHIEILYN